MPVEQRLPWHRGATGLAGQAIPFVVAASHAHALPSAPFWLPFSLLVWLPRSVCLCCSSPCLLALLGAPVAHPLLSHPPAPPVRGFHISVRRGLSRAPPLSPPLWGTNVVISDLAKATVEATTKDQWNIIRDMA